MARVAIFVDAGYLYAAGSVAIAGSNRRREDVDLNRVAAIDKLRAIADDKTNKATLLRIYWYDGVLPRGPSSQQQSLANMDDVKLRLGIISPSGQQKGVDSLIVTDMVELARNHAITDAVLLSGDEDVRIGVLITQSFGVRVHLLGIEPSRGNQADSLRQESDTTVEWSKGDVGEILTLKEGLSDQVAIQSSASVRDYNIDISTELNRIVDEFVGSLGQDRLKYIAELPPHDPVPHEFDSRLLAISRSRIERDLDESEKRYIRNKFREKTKAAAQSDYPTGT